MTDGVYNIDVDILGQIQDFLIAVADPEGVQGVPVDKTIPFSWGFSGISRNIADFSENTPWK